MCRRALEYLLARRERQVCLERATGHRGPVIPAALPGRQLKGMRAGLNLPVGDATLGTVTFDEWLAQRAV